MLALEDLKANLPRVSRHTDKAKALPLVAVFLEARPHRVQSRAAKTPVALTRPLLTKTDIMWDTPQLATRLFLPTASLLASLEVSNLRATLRADSILVVSPPGRLSEVTLRAQVASTLLANLLDFLQKEDTLLVTPRLVGNILALAPDLCTRVKNQQDHSAAATPVNSRAADPQPTATLALDTPQALTPVLDTPRALHLELPTLHPDTPQELILALVNSRAPPKVPILPLGNQRPPTLVRDSLEVLRAPAILRRSIQRAATLSRALLRALPVALASLPPVTPRAPTLDLDIRKALSPEAPILPPDTPRAASPVLDIPRVVLPPELATLPRVARRADTPGLLRVGTGSKE